MNSPEINNEFIPTDTYTESSSDRFFAWIADRGRAGSKMIDYWTDTCEITEGVWFSLKMIGVLAEGQSRLAAKRLRGTISNIPVKTTRKIGLGAAVGAGLGTFAGYIVTQNHEFYRQYPSEVPGSVLTYAVVFSAIGSVLAFASDNSPKT